MFLLHPLSREPATLWIAKVRSATLARVGKSDAITNFLEPKIASLAQIETFKVTENDQIFINALQMSRFCQKIHSISLQNPVWSCVFVTFI